MALNAKTAQDPLTLIAGSLASLTADVVLFITWDQLCSQHGCCFCCTDL